MILTYKLIILIIILLLLILYDIYANYKINKKITKYDEYNNSLWIYNNFYSQHDFNKIQKYCAKLNLKTDKRNNQRLSLCLNQHKHTKLYKLIYNTKFINFINSIKDNNVYLKSQPSFPIEYRKYFNGSKGMRWHKDSSLFYPDAFEIVLTLTNNSDSKFLWNHNTIKSINPKPNTIVIVKPNTISHSVSKINIGERTILKFVAEFYKKDEKNNKKTPTFFNEIKQCPSD